MSDELWGTAHDLLWGRSTTPTTKALSGLGSGKMGGGGDGQDNKTWGVWREVYHLSTY